MFVAVNHRKVKFAKHLRVSANPCHVS